MIVIELRFLVQNTCTVFCCVLSKIFCTKIPNVDLKELLDDLQYKSRRNPIGKQIAAIPLFRKY